MAGGPKRTKSGEPATSQHDLGQNKTNPDLDEHLAPSMVSSLQRRLGVKSPFPGLPEQADPANTEYVQESGLPFDPPDKGG